MVYCWRSSSASANTNGSSSPVTKSSSVQKNDDTPRGAGRGVGAGVDVAAARRCLHGHALEALRPAAPAPRTARVPSSSRRTFSWSRNRRSSPLTLKISALVFVGFAAEHPGLEHRVEQERGVGRLGRDARDATDVDVRPAGAVEEVDVGVQTGAPSRPSPIGIRRSMASNINAWSRSAPTARRTGAPGLGGTNVSGSSRGGADLGCLDGLGREHTVGHEEDVRVEAGPLLAGPDLGDHPGESHSSLRRRGAHGR